MTNERPRIKVTSALQKLAGRLASGLALLVFGAATPAAAISLGDVAQPDLRRAVAVISSDRGSFCSAAFVAPDLLLTAAHCVAKKANYRLLTWKSGAPQLDELGRIAVHPGYDPRGYAERRRTVDLALIKLPSPFAGATPLELQGERGAPGKRYRIAGYGLTTEGDGRTGGTLREAWLTGSPPVSGVRLRLISDDGRPVSACEGDSGGPVLRAGRLVGVLASTEITAAGCSGITGVALISTALPWIFETARAMGSPLAEPSPVKNQ